MQPPPDHPDPTSVVRAFWATLDARDWDGFGATVTDDVVATWPQSRERVRGRDGLVRFMAEFPGDWHLTLTAAYAGDAGVATRVDFALDGEVVVGLTYFTLAADGRIDGFTEYWPDPYEPPLGRDHLVERY